MSCTHCGREDWVTIGQAKYCAHCGEAASSSDKPEVASDVPTAMPTASVTLSDIKPTSTPVSQPNPAHLHHAQPSTAPSGALDLRQPTEAPVDTAVPAKKPIQVVRRLDLKAANPAKQSTPTTTAAPGRAARAASVPKSAAISRFTSSRAAAPAELSAPAPAQSLVTPTPTVIMPNAAPADLPAPAPEAPIVPATPNVPASTPAATTPEQTYNELPNQVLSQLKSMQGLIPPTAADAKSQKPAKSKAAPRAVSIAAAGMAAAVMAGYIWLNNYDSLTIKAAAQKAGIEATSPSYLPASYTLAGPISFGTGFVSMQYKSPDDSSLLTINQRKSDWTPSSLLELYVNKQAKTYLSVQSQGLTIYLLDNNQATWVNRGIQYVLQGNAQLNNEQLIKVAESL